LWYNNNHDICSLSNTHIQDKEILLEENPNINSYLFLARTITDGNSEFKNRAFKYFNLNQVSNSKTKSSEVQNENLTFYTSDEIEPCRHPAIFSIKPGTYK